MSHKCVYAKCFVIESDASKNYSVRREIWQCYKFHNMATAAYSLTSYVQITRFNQSIKIQICAQGYHLDFFQSGNYTFAMWFVKDDKKILG